MLYPLQFLFLFLLLIPTTAFASPKCELIDGTVNKVAKLRGLAVKQEVPCEVQGKDEVRSYIASAFKKQMSPARMKGEHLLYSELGMLPSTFDYENELIDVYTSQLGGYYDPHKKRYVMAGWLPGLMQETIAVHELTHALQDQHFGLAKFVDNSEPITDSSMANAALIEGDATAVMLDYAMVNAGQPQLAKQKDISAILFQQVASVVLLPDLAKVPGTIKYSMVFPYTSGIRFVQKLLQEGDYSFVDKAFKNMPQTTEEVLHPEKFLARINGKVKKNSEYIKLTKEDIYSLDKSVPKECLKKADNNNIHTDSLGEFVISLMLSEGKFVSASKSAKASAGWAGDIAFACSVNNVEDSSKQKLSYVALLANWDSKADAQEFFKAVNKKFSGWWKPKKGITKNTTETAKWSTDSGKQVSISLVDSKVLTVIKS